MTSMCDIFDSTWVLSGEPSSPQRREVRTLAFAENDILKSEPFERYSSRTPPDLSREALAAAVTSSLV